MKVLGHVVVMFVTILSKAATSEVEVFVDERAGRKRNPSMPPTYVPLTLELGAKSKYLVIPWAVREGYCENK